MAVVVLEAEAVECEAAAEEDNRFFKNSKELFQSETALFLYSNFGESNSLPTGFFSGMVLVSNKNN